jgi:hypothetical protein
MKFRPRKKRRSWALLWLLFVLAIAGLGIKFALREPPVQYASVRHSELPYTIGPILDANPLPGEAALTDAPAEQGEAVPSLDPPAVAAGAGNAAKVDASAESAEKEPAQYKDAGYFEGGKAADGLALTAIRFGKHPDFRRIVIDFGIIDRNDPTKTVEPEVHPKYKIEYHSCPYRFTITFSGVQYLDDAVVQKKDSLPFGLVVTSDGVIKQLEFFLTRPAMFKVIEVDGPARLAIDIKFKSNVEVPRVNVVQVVGIESVERAFELAETGRFPVAFKPQIVVIGDKFFVEGIYDTFEQAVEVSAELEKLNYSTIISERKGNAFPGD